MPTGELVFITDPDENVQRVSTIGRAFVSESFNFLKKHSPKNISSASGGTGFDSCPVANVKLYSESGNNVMWWGGIGSDAPYSGHGCPLYGGQKTEIPITNFNALRVCANTSGQVVYLIGHLNGASVDLDNTLPTRVDTVQPFVLSHFPVSGATGISATADIHIIFSEAVSSDSLTSGAFRLTPAHDATLFRDSMDSSKIVLSPNTAFSGGATYIAILTSGSVTDLQGNPCMSGITWPFTVSGTAAPDTTPPTVASFSPVSGASSVAITTSPIVVFSEKMLSGTINVSGLYLSTISGTNRNTGRIAGTVTLNSSDQKTVTLDPTNDLSDGTVYYITVETLCKDLAGNAKAALEQAKFTTVQNLSIVFNNPSDGSATHPIGEGIGNRAGIVLTGSCALLNSIPKKVLIKLQLGPFGSPTGTGYIRIRNSSDVIQHTFSQTLDLSTITSSFVEYTFEDLSQNHTMVNGDRLLFEPDPVPPFDGYFNLGIINSNPYAGTSFTYHDSSSYTNTSTQEMGAIVYA